MAVRRGKKTYRKRSQKLGAVLKRDGIFKGSGQYVGHQIGGPLGKAAKTVVPAMLLLVAASAVTPQLGNALAGSVRGIPVVAPLAAVSASYGTQLRSRFGR
jgi:hypothetical protein